MIRGVIFDMDGTLLDSMGVWDGVVQRIVSRFGVQFTEQDLQHMESMSQIQVFCYLCEKYPQISAYPDQLSREMDDIIQIRYQTMAHKMQGVDQLMTYLQHRKIKIAVATLTARKIAESVLAFYGLQPYLHTLVTVDEVGASKRTPNIYWDTANLLELAPEECLVCEDAPYAAQAAKEGGFLVCGVTSAWYADAKQQLYQASDIVIQQDFAELQEFLRKM